MSESHDPRDAEETVAVAGKQGLVEYARKGVASGAAKARSAGNRHVSIAVPFRAVERNRRVAASVLAGGFAYRLFVWLLPFSLIVGGALGLGDADDVQDAVAPPAPRAGMR